MKIVYANLKRFDIPATDAGVNRLIPSPLWGKTLSEQVQQALETVAESFECALFLPEAHLLPAILALSPDSGLHIGCQGVYRRDTEAGGNFGAFTTQRTAKSMAAIGCRHTIIGHCEERADKAEMISFGGSANPGAVNRLLREEVACAQAAGMTVLYCVGEKAEEQDRWEEVIGEQLATGLDGIDLGMLRIAYEPVWAIGPGRPVPDAAYIGKVARLCKKLYPQVPVLYGGGLKQDNAAMLAGIPEIDGGLVGLTRFQGEIGFYPSEFADIVTRYLA